MDSNEICTRDLPCIRENDNKPEIVGEYLEGWAIKYNEKSRLIHEKGQSFFESFEPGAFGDLGKRNVRFNFRHDDDAQYGDTQTGTLVLNDTPEGLRFKLALPKYAHTLRASVANQIAKGMSVGFKPKKIEERNGVRHVLSADLDHIALAFNPCYLQTSVELKKVTPLSTLKKKQELLEK